jgi:anaerobic dimethyl sulfoxide reductase subunit B (iron-sulfur subunit)
MAQLAFLVNSDACSGCKTCQIACKDRHDLPPGILWRRVYEVTAGAWQKKDGVWQSTTIAYTLSVACNHCVFPVCGAQCPSDAIWKRPDGLVIIDDARCTRCRKCEADCPYGAIRWDAVGARVSKCDGCAQDVDSGMEPACVAACPGRALVFGELDDLRKRYGDLNRVFPLADGSIANPALVIVAHRNAALAEKNQPQVANREEL